MILALGRAGTPRKLGVPGEELPHVLYRLIEADHYTNNKILVVGGGDSAVEAAMGLAHQTGNKVTMSYRKGEFSRMKDRNTKRMEEYMQRQGGSAVQLHAHRVQPGAAYFDVGGTIREIPNDYVWIFAGGIPPMTS